MHIPKKLFLAVIILLVAIPIAVFAVMFQSKKPVITTDNSKNYPQIKITTSGYNGFFLVKQLLPDVVDIVNISEKSQEPHEYELTAKDVLRLQDSDIIIANGYGLEGWLDSYQNSTKNSSTKILDFSKSIGDDQKTKGDPHFWLSLGRQKTLVNAISNKILQNPKLSSYNSKIEINRNNIIKKLSELESDYKNTINQKNCKLQTIVTSHDAFGYLASDLSIKQIPINGINPNSESSSKELIEIIEKIKSSAVKYIFLENGTNQKTIESIKNAIGVEILELNPAESLASVGSGDYLSSMRENLNSLAKGLECGK